jgi:hypothetical protein
MESGPDADKRNSETEVSSQESEDRTTDVRAAEGQVTVRERTSNNQLPTPNLPALARLAREQAGVQAQSILRWPLGIGCWPLGIESGFSEQNAEASAAKHVFQ